MHASLPKVIPISMQPTKRSGSWFCNQRMARPLIRDLRAAAPFLHVLLLRSINAAPTCWQPPSLPEVLSGIPASPGPQMPDPKSHS